MEFWKKDYVEEMVLEFGADRVGKNPGIEMWTMETATMGTKAHWCNSSWVTQETTNHSTLRWDWSARIVVRGRQNRVVIEHKALCTVVKSWLLERSRSWRHNLWCQVCSSNLHFGIKAKDSLSWGRYGGNKTRWEAGEFSKERVKMQCKERRKIGNGSTS